MLPPHHHTSNNKAKIGICIDSRYSTREIEKEREEMRQASRFKRICIFCGSSAGNKTSYRDAAVELARELMRQASRFKRICVFCGSSAGNKTSYHDAAVELARELVTREIDLVYGGGSIGLMGLVSQTVHHDGRHVIGVIPKTLMTNEVTGETVGEVRPVEDMHERKAEMAKQSDAFIALPGGYGTLEELLEVVTWAQLGIHRKPVGLLNVDGYYNSLLTFIDHAVEEGFVSPNACRIIISAPTPLELMDKLEEYIPYYDTVASKLKWETRITYDATDDSESQGWIQQGGGRGSSPPYDLEFNVEKERKEGENQVEEEGYEPPLKLQLGSATAGSNISA